ncbi:hypothetical protein BV25DRAFT_1883939 [Artomyces pyxidatus]|uniref:Uncharacterized protein n=1 Tax=Artomyces pyxidatus TaxID=48021 RepID=A0ACB8T5P7_9AGAM|nr:hypothetical protein BV25DRAFT_1883939 [Artomyces pyxidatus]
MAQRRTSHSRLQISVPTSTSPHHPRYKLRHSPTSRRRVISLVRRFRQPATNSHASSASTSPSSEESRQVLAPLQFNLRRLPSRLAFHDKETMRYSSDMAPIQVGAKRKRVVSGSENAHAGRITRDGIAFKRRRGSLRSEATTDDDGEASTMDIDEYTRSGDEDDDLDSSEDYLISQAPPRQLLRLRKDHLLHLYTAAGLSDEAEVLTKQDIVDAIVAVRDDVADLPPSSPPGRDGNSSEYSSDEGNVAGGEETDIGGRHRSGPTTLRRRVTVHDLGRAPTRPTKGRSLSLGQIQSPSQGGGTHKKRKAEIPPESCSAERPSAGSRSSPTTSTASMSLPSPPATRLRSRKVSSETVMPADSSSQHKSKGKAKQVEFSEEVQVASPEEEDELSDLTELSESDQGTITISPSPRRLRSQSERTASSRRGRPPSDEEVTVRTPPKRRAKDRIGSLHEDDGDQDHAEDEGGEDDEVDELISSQSPSPPPPLRTPVKRRLRPRRIQTHTPPSDADADDGDDEEEEEAEDEEAEEAEEEAEDDGEEEDLEGDEDDATLVEPRKLRNGKVVGEEDVEEGSEEEVQEDMSIDEEVDVDVDVDVEEGESDESREDGDEYVDEAMEEVDLTIATAKSLVRLRRDDLVRLCESRFLDVDGTKPQLAEALLQWRDRQTEASSPSSVGTIRPPSTARPRANGRKRRSNSGTPPVLLRSHHMHMDEPRTPPLSPGSREEELELDLESLGLEDREIAPEKLTKLEKIGSGGFKDVFIGKFRGRKVALAEFRGHLTAMDIKELKLLGGFDHPNIVRFLGVSIPEDTRVTPVTIVSELCSNGDLFDYVRNVLPPSLYRVLCMMLDIARGLEYLHQRKPSVIHRDCKSSNILITSKGTAKIADFGLAKVKQSTRSMVRSLVGTVNWQAPELWHAHPKYNHKVDVFACGMVFWEMLQWHLPNKKFPWEGMNEHAIYDIVGAKRQRPSLSGLRKQWCPEIVELVERMWAHEHQERPTMTEVVSELEDLVRMYR